MKKQSSAISERTDDSNASSSAIPNDLTNKILNEHDPNGIVGTTQEQKQAQEQSQEKTTSNEQKQQQNAVKDSSSDKGNDLLDGSTCNMLLCYSSFFPNEDDENDTAAVGDTEPAVSSSLPSMSPENPLGWYLR